MAIAASWIQSGVVQDPHLEFFVQKTDGARLKPQDDLKIDWEHEFKLRFWVDRNNKECPVEPRILKGKTQKILDAGKSVRLSLYLRSNPQNFEVSKLILEKPNINKAIVDELEEQKGLDTDSLSIHQEIESFPVPKSRPSFNMAIKKDLYPKTIFKRAVMKTPIKGRWNERVVEKMDNELEMTPNLGVASTIPPMSVFNQLISSNKNRSLISFEIKKIKDEETEPINSSRSDDYQSQIAKKIRLLLEANIKTPNPGYIFHKSLTEIYSTSVTTTTSVIASNLGHLLHSSFDINKIMRTVRYVFVHIRAIYFLDCVHLAQDSFNQLLYEVIFLSFRWTFMASISRKRSSKLLSRTY
jgi:hypothetical protein